jgi:protein-tyrosine phosphatase
MAEGILRARLAARGVDAAVSSTGTSFTGHAASPDAVATVRAMGVDIDAHRSRMLARDQIVEADLIVAMERAHVRETVLIDPAALERTFTLKELVRRAKAAGPRLAAEPMEAYVRRIGFGRPPADHLGRSSRDDVPDPYGQSAVVYADVARQLDQLLADLVDHLWPDAASDRAPAGSATDRKAAS